VKTKYALILNPDVIVEKNFFEEMNIYFEKKIDFHLMGSSQINNKVDSAGFFNDIEKKMKFKNEKKSNSCNIWMRRLRFKYNKGLQNWRSKKYHCNRY